MYIYGIATKSREVYGHGDTRTEWKICPLGSYKFPPFFNKPSEAEAYRVETFKHGETKVVPVELT